jgi:RNA polymerase sigma-70 factor (ECF subfamily)
LNSHYAKYSNDELYILIQKDDNGAFTELYRRFRGRVYAFAYRMLSDRDKANDIFQETFIKIYESRHRSDILNIGGYIIRISRNLCLNYIRNNKPKTELLEDHIIVFQTDFEDKELSDLIAKALDHIPTNYREVLVLREYDGMSYQEIAEVTEQTVQSVKIQIFRAKVKLRKLLAPYWKIVNEV